MTPPPPRLSVIIPARNAAQYLTRALPALRGAWSEDYELIVVDDCSTDETAQVAGNFGAKVVLLAQAGISAFGGGRLGEPSLPSAGGVGGEERRGGGGAGRCACFSGRGR